MNQFREPQFSRMLLALATSGQTSQALPFSLTGDQAIGGVGTDPTTTVALNTMQRGDIIQGTNGTTANIFSVFRIPTQVKAIRLRAYVSAPSDPSGATAVLRVGLYPRLFGDKLSWSAQGIGQTPPEATARSAGSRSTVTLTPKATEVGTFTVNPFTGEAFPSGISGSVKIYPTNTAVVVGALDTLLASKGFNTANDDSGWLLIDPSFSEYLLVGLGTISNLSTIPGIFIVLDTEAN